jgi:hypothetical protein
VLTAAEIFYDNGFD